MLYALSTVCLPKDAALIRTLHPPTSIKLQQRKVMKIVIILGCPSFGLSSFVSSPIRQVGPSFSRCVYAQDCSNKHQRQNQFSVDSQIGFSKERAGHFALNAKNDNFLFEEFSTADGEVINPYKVLRLDKDAEKNDIRRSFRALSKMYHPDGVRFSDELPGEW